MKLLLDMDLAPRIAAFLSGLGHDEVHLRDRGLEKSPDSEVVKLAEFEQRVVVTFDLDYPRIICPAAIGKAIHHFVPIRAVHDGRAQRNTQ